MMKESLEAHASKGKKSCVLSCRQLDRNRREKKEEVKKIQEISIFVNRLFFFLFRESWSGSEGGGRLEVGHWSLVVVTLVMALVGWLGLVLVSEPSPEGHGAAFCASTGFHWLVDLWSMAS